MGTIANNLGVTIPVKLLDAKHPYYADNAAAWNDIELLYRGGHALKAKAEHFLAKRPKELAEVYAARAARFTYQNILGTALGWYEAAMFKDDPDIHVKRGDGDPEGQQAEFYSRFLADCDRNGTTYVDTFRRVLRSLMLYRSAFVLTDLPKTAEQPATLAEQKSSGALDPYLVLYDPRQVINWETDPYGNLAWIVIATTTEERAFGSDAAVIDRWYYFDATEYRVYQAKRERLSEKAQTASLIDAGPHALADASRVPVRWVQVSDGLWLANRVYLHALAHLNLQNAYYWGLTMGCLPVPVIIGEYSEPPTVSETAYIHLPEAGSKFEYAEPSGRTYEVSAREIQAIREEMYRQLSLQAQGRSTAATPAAQSGFSKEMDMAPSRDVLNALGDVLRAAMQSVLGDVAEIRGDRDVTFDVRGFTFDDDTSIDELAVAQAAADLGIPSDTLEKEVQKRVAHCLLKDARPDVIQRVEGEIDAAQGRQQRLAAEDQRRREQIRGSLATVMLRTREKQMLRTGEE
jgi:hypothetical protein